MCTRWMTPPPLDPRKIIRACLNEALKLKTLAFCSTFNLFDAFKYIHRYSWVFQVSVETGTETWRLFYSSQQKLHLLMITDIRRCTLTCRRAPCPSHLDFMQIHFGTASKRVALIFNFQLHWHWARTEHRMFAYKLHLSLKPFAFDTSP